MLVRIFTPTIHQLFFIVIGLLAMSHTAMPAQQLDSTNLPIIVINTNSQTIPNEPKITCDMGIIYNGPGQMNHIADPFNNYNGKIAIEERGSSSSGFPKKSYGFETRTPAGTKNDVMLLGMPAEHDWILSASYSDKTHLRNALSYKLYNDMGRYAPRTVHCELLIDGIYQGVYVLTERIKRDPNRVNIAKLNTWENAGDSLTGGYMIKIDKTTGNGGAGWTSPFPPPVNGSGQTIYFQYEYPDPDSITWQQKNYIQQYVDSFETTLNGPNYADTLNGYVKYCKVNSFIDYFILNELSKNIDGYRLSTYLYKDKYSNGGKLGIGPPWDYDIAWLNANYCGSPSSSGWAYQFGNVCPGDGWQLPFWWNRFLQDPNFRNALKCRWLYLRSTILTTAYINAYIDSNVTYLTSAMGRNFTKWPILGVYVWPNPSPIPTTYSAEIFRLKQWIASRVAWLDANMPGGCTTSGVEESAMWSGVRIFPNPASTRVDIELLNQKNEGGELTDLMGRHLLSLPAGPSSFSIDLSGLAAGVYLLQLRSGENVAQHKIIKAD